MLARLLVNLYVIVKCTNLSGCWSGCGLFLPTVLASHRDEKLAHS
jgi:hypothetical protein